MFYNNKNGLYPNFGILSIISLEVQGEQVRFPLYGEYPFLGQHFIINVSQAQVLSLN
jgi:hypothetical protein